ncbi:MAG TPA: imidazole glycerol phosphate synthase subunit HisH [Cytophagaceae bacterium]|jgi:glutamine amidotransferase|nr:imidazole glycerol phosphate synthase subunit HisH [Cytophagaceae bacterium]
MRVAIVKYNAGNIRSVAYALNRLGIEPEISDDPEVLSSVDKVIFPGVGEASTAMSYLKKDGLDKLIPSLQQPVLGICLGLQLMCRHSEENDTDCLNIFPVQVKKFPAMENIKVPQIGWNTVRDLKSPLFKGIAENAYMYFVHSYYAEQNSFAIATTDYMFPYTSAIQKDNFYAVQFHAEKSGDAGGQIIENFIRL